MDWGDVAYEAAYWGDIEDRAQRLGLLGADIDEALALAEKLGRRLASAEGDATMAIAVLNDGFELPEDDDEPLDDY